MTETDIIFAKYIPIKGKDQYKGEPCDKNDKCFYDSSQPCKSCGRIRGRLVKFCAMSADFKVGDIIFWIDDVNKLSIAKEEDIKYRDDVDPYGHLKVIGELSPNASRFVKDGDEIDTQVEVIENPLGSKDKHSTTGKYLVKGPCGHFH